MILKEKPHKLTLGHFQELYKEFPQSNDLYSAIHYYLSPYERRIKEPEFSWRMTGTDKTRIFRPGGIYVWQDCKRTDDRKW